MKIKFHKKESSRWAKSFEDAHAKGYFTGSMTRDELMARITRYNPQVRWYASEHSMALFHSSTGFICAITRASVIPQFSIFRKDPSFIKKVNFCTEDGEYTNSEYINRDPDEGKMIARGWPITFKILETKGLKIDKRGLSESYFWDFNWKD